MQSVQHRKGLRLFSCVLAGVAVSACLLSGCGGGGGGGGLRVRTVSASGELQVINEISPENQERLDEALARAKPGDRQTEPVLLEGNIFVIAPVLPTDPASTPRPVAILLPQRALGVRAERNFKLIFSALMDGVLLRAEAGVAAFGELQQGIAMPPAEGAELENEDGVSVSVVEGDESVSVGKVIFRFDVRGDGKTSLPRSYKLTLPKPGQSTAGTRVELRLDPAAAGQKARLRVEHTAGFIDRERTVSADGSVVFAPEEGAAIGTVQTVILTTSLP